MNRVQVVFGVLVLVLLGSCKSTKMKGSTLGALSTKKVLKAHDKASFSKNTIEARIKTHYKDARTAQSLTIKLRIKKDEVIWMSGSFLGFTVAKVKITPTSVQYYEKVKRTYFDGDFSLISSALGTELNFQQLQNLLLGNAVLGFDEGKFISQPDKKSYLITPKNQDDLMAIFYWINPTHYKLDKQELRNMESNQKLSIDYPEYQTIEREHFPKEILINASQGKQNTRIEMEFRNVVFNKTLRFPFSIPEGYHEIDVNDYK